MEVEDIVARRDRSPANEHVRDAEDEAPRVRLAEPVDPVVVLLAQRAAGLRGGDRLLEAREVGRAIAKLGSRALLELGSVGEEPRAPRRGILGVGLHEPRELDEQEPRIIGPGRALDVEAGLPDVAMLSEERVDRGASLRPTLESIELTERPHRRKRATDRGHRADEPGQVVQPLLHALQRLGAPLPERRHVGRGVSGE